MTADFINVYEDQVRADAYAKLDFPGTYYLAFRDLPTMINEHVRGTKALDFGCGTGRSTRFLKGLGFDSVVGVDISEQMVSQARKLDPEGEYHVVPAEALGTVVTAKFDLVFSAFTFDNIPTLEKKILHLAALKERLSDKGRIINLVSSPEIYLHEWASFSTKDFPENSQAECGGKVRIVMLDVEDSRPVEDILWTDDGYREVYLKSGLHLIATNRPLGLSNEPYGWVSETSIAPWVIYILKTET